jgi:8-oxo-dGTP pyrophosphatase MutT (NUDIX family)
LSSIDKWEVLRSHLVLDNPWCRIRQDEVKLPNGQVIPDFFVRVKPDIALTIPVTTDGNVVFVRQYRHGVGKILLELPAGRFQREQESAQSAACRELQEETGYLASHWQQLAVLHDNPVNDTNSIYVFLARGAYVGSDRALDSTEDIEIVTVPTSQVRDRLLAGDIDVAGSVAALGLASCAGVLSF